ncbi:MAG: 3-hydroxyacyl-CoA dehydrogenase family protein [bacterium]
MDIKKIAVVGAGLMGGGISQVSAQSGYSVVMIDVSEEQLEKAVKAVSWSLGKLIEKGKVEGNREEILSRIKPTTRFEEAENVDFVVEAVFEDKNLKKQVFEKLDGVVRERAVLATNTSAIPVTEMASATKRPDRVVGTHFFSPVPLMQVVEVVRGVSTSDETVETARNYVKSLGKEAITVNRDIAGFLLNRINMPSNVEAMRMLEMGVATAEDIDRGMRLGFGRAMGPFETGDMVGLDVTYGALMAIYEETKDPKFHPPVILQRKVRAGHLGRKAGKGWYEYDEDGKRK